MATEIDLIVPMKSPRTAKSRLRATGPLTTDEEHEALVLALAEDTVAAANATPGVRGVLVVTDDVHALAGLRAQGARLVHENAAEGLNAAVRHGEALLRSWGRDGVLGALQGDLPALRPTELAGALTEADGHRAFVSDRHETGTTLLVSAPHGELAPGFGGDSARVHTASGARPLPLAAPSLRADVDTIGDLAHARRVGLGPRTSELLEHGVPSRPCTGQWSA